MAGETARGAVVSAEPTRLAQAAARRAAEAAATMPAFSASVRVSEPLADGALLAAVARALRAVPAANGAWSDGRAERYSRVNLGLALPGPVTPVVFDADARTPDGIAEELAVLRARDPESFTAAELAGATFTVTGLGLGLDTLAPLLVPRQAAGLGVGAERLMLVCDARVLSPADGANLLAALV